MRKTISNSNRSFQKMMSFRAMQICALLYALLLSFSLKAQNNISFCDNIKTIDVRVDGKWGTPPVMMAGRGHFVDISFDDLKHEYERYSYRIIHCDAEWKRSEIYEGDYLKGMNGTDVLEDYEQSQLSEMEYNHYSFRLPNQNTQLLLSGNYKVEIIDENKKTMAQACFSILTPRVKVDIELSANTDIDTYDSHQQVSFTIDNKNYDVANPESEFKPVVTQNHRWATHVSNLKPTFIRNGGLSYNHNRRLIFPAGNEYRRFEIIDRKAITMGIEKMYFDNNFYCAQVGTDAPRKNYLYDQDQNGRFFIRNSESLDNDSESDYIFTDFKLRMPKIYDGKIYLYGDFTGEQLTEDYEMEYNDLAHQYELTIPLKQGLYNYMYLYLGNGETVGTFDDTEGNFYQTENEYYVYVYQRAFGDRYDQLVGFASKTFNTTGE